MNYWVDSVIVQQHVPGWSWVKGPILRRVDRRWGGGQSKQRASTSRRSINIHRAGVWLPFFQFLLQESTTGFFLKEDALELLKPEEFIQLCGLTDEEFFTLADASFATIADGYKNSIDEEYREKTIRDIYENNKELLSYEYLTPFFSPDGHLCFEGYICELGDQGWDHHMIDTETQQIVEFVPIDVMWWKNTRFDYRSLYRPIFKVKSF